VIGVLAKCLQILEIGHLKNNFPGIQKAIKRKMYRPPKKVRLICTPFTGQTGERGFV
jgi:hypothetical protein